MTIFFTPFLNHNRYKLSRLEGTWYIEQFHPEIGWVIHSEHEYADEVLEALVEVGRHG